MLSGERVRESTSQSRQIKASKNFSGFEESFIKSSCQKLTFCFNNERHNNVFSLDKTSRKLRKKFPPLICRYCEKRRSKGSLWNLAVTIKL